MKHCSITDIFLVAITGVTLVLGPRCAYASTLDHNIALSSLGAQAFDNGHWVEQSLPNRGWEYKASLTIDDDATWYAGLGSLQQQQLWVVFDQQYDIDAVFIDELDICYSHLGALEYRQDGSWMSLGSFSKSTPDHLTTFIPRRADAIRLTVTSTTVPRGWINQNAECVYSFEVRGVPASTLKRCQGDLNGDNYVTIDELIAGINTALNGCEAPLQIGGTYQGQGQEILSGDCADPTGVPRSLESITLSVSQDGASLTGSYEGLTNAGTPFAIEVQGAVDAQGNLSNGTLSAMASAGRAFMGTLTGRVVGNDIVVNYSGQSGTCSVLGSAVASKSGS